VNKTIKIVLSAAMPALLAAGCSDFLKGGDLTTSPNNPVKGSASNNQLFVSIQANMFSMQETNMARGVAQWMQSLVGAARQQVGYYDYSGVDNSTFDVDFQQPYIGGGLLDLRTIESSATTSGDQVYLGIAQVMEAWMMGQTADMWGDIPYTQAANYGVYPTPILDPQQAVYDSVEALLGRAITNLAGAGAGPGDADLVYFGDPAAWTELAHTLRARFYLHQAEVLGNAMYTSALAEANQGISSNAGDYIAIHDGTIQLSSNLWWQFMAAAGGTGRSLDLVASVGPASTHSTLWNMMVASADPRFTQYFDVLNAGDGFMSTVRLSGGFPQPIVTYNENQLIKAEAELHVGTQLNADAALAAEMASWGSVTAWHTAVVLTPPGPGVTLAQVMTEKYITLFQNLEVWNDWKRTCLPALTVVPPGTSVFGGGKIPARVWYGSTEQQTNPNIPPVGTAPNGDTNWNDPVRCP
jgi:starch-binding outer membrane protein, SusD/RagB family